MIMCKRWGRSLLVAAPICKSNLTLAVGIKIRDSSVIHAYRASSRAKWKNQTSGVNACQVKCICTGWKILENFHLVANIQIVLTYPISNALRKMRKDITQMFDEKNCFVCEDVAQTSDALADSTLLKFLRPLTKNVLLYLPTECFGKFFGNAFLTNIPDPCWCILSTENTPGQHN